MHGWMGKILRIDLNRMKTSSHPLTKEQTEMFLGGRGLGADMLFHEIPRRTDPLSPENKLILATGPLTGTGAPTSGRYSITTKSPQTGTAFDSNSGGHFGVQFKRCGFDAAVIEGRAEKPSYVWMRDEAVEIRNAEHIWGSNTHSTEDVIRSETSKDAKVACIGPAGEKQVLISSIINDKHRAAGRGGVGAVMGSKQLKAIAVQGSHETSIADKEEFTSAARVSLEAVSKNPVTKDALPNFGTSVLVNVMNEIGALPTLNFQKGYFEDADAISGETIRERILEKRVACDACTIACGRETKIPDRDRRGEGPEYETVWAFGAACGVRDLEAIVEANYLCNEYGLDTISTGSTIACAMELSARGHLSEGPKFGDADALLSLVGMIALIIKTVLIMAKGTTSGVTTSLAAFLPIPSLGSAPSILHRLLSKFDIFTIWEMILWIIGISVMYRFTTKKSAVLIGIIWGCWVVVSVALGGLFANLGM